MVSSEEEVDVKPFPSAATFCTPTLEETAHDFTGTDEDPLSSTSVDSDATVDHSNESVPFVQEGLRVEYAVSPTASHSKGEDDEKIVKKLSFYHRGRNLSVEKVDSIMGDFETCERLLTPPSEPNIPLDKSRLNLPERELELLTQDERAAGVSARFLKEFYGNILVKGRLHDRNNGPRGQKLLCEDCALSFGTNSALLVHKEAVHGLQKPWGCSPCGNKHKNRSALLRHVAWARFGKRVKCRRQQCYEMFANTEDRRIHMVAEHGRIKCPDCDEEFDDYPFLERHKIYGHATAVEAGTFTCVICKKDDFENRVQHVEHEKQCR